MLYNTKLVNIYSIKNVNWPQESDKIIVSEGIVVVVFDFVFVVERFSSSF